MYRDSIAARIAVWLLVVLSCAFAAAVPLAVADDFLRRDVMPKAATVDGLAVAELPLSSASEAVRGHVKATLLSPATVRFKDRSFDLDPTGLAEVDVEGMVSDALAPKRTAGIAQRVYERIGGPSLGKPVERRMRIDEAKLAAWIDDVNDRVATPAKNATVSIEATGLRIIPEITGYQVDTTAAVPAVAKALLAGDKDISLPVRSIEATLTQAKFGKMIMVDISQRKLWLYDGPKLVKTYGCAVGTGGYPTPRGNFKIINKRYMPSWSNPAPNGWGAGMPASIGPGPSNPLGTRALDLDSPGIRIHGTNKDYSIGTAASHGCMRMHRWDIEQLYELVPVGTPVFIVS